MAAGAALLCDTLRSSHAIPLRLIVYHLTISYRRRQHTFAGEGQPPIAKADGEDP
jgi:hypothetical protein